MYTWESHVKDLSSKTSFPDCSWVCLHGMNWMKFGDDLLVAEL